MPRGSDEIWYRRFERVIERSKGPAYLVIGALSFIAILAAQVLPPLQEILITRGVFAAVTLIVVIDLARATIRAANRIESVDVMRNQDESIQYLVDELPNCRRDTVEFLEYAGATTLPLIRAVQREGVALRLLIKHPETVQGIQQQRMVTTLDTLYTSVFEDYSGSFEARCYRQPYGLRARKLGTRVLELGWLTPDYKRKTAFGHDNPSLLLRDRNGSNAFFYDFFDRTFDDLWNAPDTEDALAVLKRMQESGTNSLQSTKGVE